MSSYTELQISKNIMCDMKQVGDPFGTNPAEKLGMELADNQNDSQLKRAFQGHNLFLSFYRQYVSPQTFPNLSYLALRYIALFGSTYHCEQLFSRMANIKTDSKPLLAHGQENV